MPNLPISAHITVVSAAPAATAEGPAAAAAPSRDKDFSSLLATQLAATAGAAASTALEAAPDRPASAAAQAQSGADPASAVAVMAFLPFAPVTPGTHPQPPTDGQDRAEEPGHASKPALALGTGTATAPGGRDLRDDPPAAELPANLAAGDGPLPVKTPERPAADALAPVVEHAARLPAQPESIGAELAAPTPGWMAHAAVAPKTEAVAAAPAAAVSLESRVGSPSWGTELGQKVLWLANQQQQIAHINVTPPQLGPIEIRLDLTHDQASATFVSPHAAVRDAIEAALPRLRDLLAESGLTLANVDVSAHSFGHARQDAPRQEGAPRGALADGMAAGALAGVAPAGLAGPSRSGEGLVDIFA